MQGTGFEGLRHVGLSRWALFHLRAFENVSGSFSTVSMTQGLPGNTLDRVSDIRHIAMCGTVQHKGGKSHPQGQ